MTPYGLLRGALTACAALVLLVLGAAVPASAHATLRGSDPADGTVLQRAPRELTLTFSESVGLLTDSFRVYDPRNHRLRTGEAGHAPGRSDTARLALPARLGKGTYTVAWRVVSADSHPVSGALTFSVGERTATPVTALPERTENQTTTGLYNIARYLAYLAMALLLGTAAFAVYCRPPSRGHLRPLLLVGAWTLLGTTLALLVLRGPYEEGTSPANAFSLLSRTMTTRPGELLLVRLLLLLIAAAGALTLRHWRRRVPRRAALTAAVLLSVALALTWSASDHASAGLQVPVALASTTLHLLATAAWLGGLAALLLTLRRATDPEALPPRVVTRFSRVALTSVVVLVITGTYQSWRGLGSWQALTGTSYGRILLAKLAAVVLLLLAAAWSRVWTASLARRPVAAERVRVLEGAGAPAALEAPEPVSPSLTLTYLRRSVLAEAAVGVVVLVLTTLLTSTLPGRAAEESSGAGAGAGAGVAGIPSASVTTIPFDTGAPGGRGQVQITLDPGRVGPNSVQAVVYGPDGGLASVPELRIAFVLPSRDLGPLDTKVTNRGGYWAADTFSLPMPGTWTMKATVRVSELDQVTVERSVRVGR
ncbi:copper resistance CopC family protein [Streptomyces sp. LaPpAH-108]|uniref:copper resistance CopC/CopD family protein n=1 Tax=Streptomyces sp. LaPpAH-108 TaxID=1155714 RepID=UPI0006849487|nr:copper resistance CopC family protein [Streptomyces sp. LaPpAH-108]